MSLRTASFVGWEKDESRDLFHQDNDTSRPQTKPARGSSVQKEVEDINQPKTKAGLLLGIKNYQATQIYITPWVQCRKWCDTRAHEIEV